MKHHDFLSDLLANQARAKILRLFILNETESFTAVDIAKRVQVPSATVEKEAKELERMGVIKVDRTSDKVFLEKESKGKKGKSRMVWTFNMNGKFGRPLSTFVHEVAPAQFKEVEDALKGTGRLSAIVLSGIFTGDPTRPADLLIVGDFVNERRLERAVKSFEPRFGREIRYAVLSTPEFRYRLTISDKLVRDTLDFPHRVILNKGNLF